ncbi:hypothetical protein P7C73_g6034, partial [Tremellales sp. Uapishka_1]
MTNLEDVCTPHFEERIKTAMKTFDVPGCVLVLVKGNPNGSYQEIIRPFGKRDSQNPMTAETTFAIASNSKLVTSIAVLRALAGEGLDCRARVKDILPQYEMVDKFAQEECTVEDVLTHRTGMPAFDHIWGPNYIKTPLLERLKFLPPCCGFRQEHHYCNIMYDLIPLIVEKLSGIPFERFVKTKILEPAAMTSTDFSPSSEAAVGYWKKLSLKGENKSIALPSGLHQYPGAEGAMKLWSNGVDMAKWLKTYPQLDEWESCSKAKVVTIPFTSDAVDTTKTYGFGTMQYAHRGQSFILHPGNLDTFNTVVARLPDIGVGFALLVNSNGSYFRQAIIMMLIEAFCNLPLVDWQARMMKNKIKHDNDERQEMKAIDCSGEAGKEIIGTYSHPGFDTWVLTKENNVKTRPELTSLPPLASCHGAMKPLFAPMQNGTYEGFWALTFKQGDHVGQTLLGKPFQAELKDDGKKLWVCGMSDIRDGLKKEDHPLVMTRID